MPEHGSPCHTQAEAGGSLQVQDQNRKEINTKVTEHRKAESLTNGHHYHNLGSHTRSPNTRFTLVFSSVYKCTWLNRMVILGPKISFLESFVEQRTAVVGRTPSRISVLDKLDSSAVADNVAGLASACEITLRMPI